MTEIFELWQPSLLSAVIVFIASSLIHMLLGWHKSDFRQAPDEEKVMDTIRPLGIPPGDYCIPRPSTPAEMNSPEFVEKVKKGPVMIATVLPNEMAPMSRNLILWFLYVVAVNTLAGHVAQGALSSGAPYRVVFHTVGLAAFLGYSGALWPSSIWYRRSWSTTIKSTIDGLIYASLTAGTFGWLWPK